MKALSIKQPWAWLILNGGKDVENRTWQTKYRGRFFVHASKKVDVIAYNHIKQQNIPLPAIKDLEVGGIVGSVELVDCDPLYSSFWKQSGSWGFVLKDPKPCKFIEYKGQLNFFEVKGVEDLHELVNSEGNMKL